eukprot:gene6776-16572_t
MTKSGLPLITPEMILLECQKAAEKKRTVCRRRMGMLINGADS